MLRKGPAGGKTAKGIFSVFLFLFKKSSKCSCSRHLCAGLQPAGEAAAATRGAGAEGEEAGEAADPREEEELHEARALDGLAAKDFRLLVNDVGFR